MTLQKMAKNLMPFIHQDLTWYCTIIFFVLRWLKPVRPSVTPWRWATTTTCCGQHSPSSPASSSPSSSSRGSAGSTPWPSSSSVWRDGWPLPNVATEANGDSRSTYERGSSLVSSLARSTCRLLKLRQMGTQGEHMKGVLPWLVHLLVVPAD